MNEEINKILELSENDKNLHHKKGHGGLLFITLSMIQFSKLKRYIKELQQENRQLELELSGYRQAILNDKEMLGLKDKNTQLRIEISAIEEDYRKLENNWDELKEYIGQEWYSYDNDSVECEVSKDILNKMKELESDISDEN